MKPILHLRFQPDIRCEDCGSWGYADEIFHLCFGCTGKRVMWAEKSMKKPVQERLRGTIAKAKETGLLRENVN